MKYVRFSCYQFLLFLVLLVVNIVLDPYTKGSFTYVDLMKSFIWVMIFSLIVRLYKQFDDIRLRYKLLLAIPIFLLAGIVGAALLGKFTLHVS
jgi:hypothetical protein